MNVALLGRQGPLAGAVFAELERRRHRVDASADSAIYFPGTPEDLENVVTSGRFRRLVLRSSACAYGASSKNPGLMTEDRISLLSPDAPEQRWLRLEAVAARHPNSVTVRLANVLDPGEGDLLVQQLAKRCAIALAGHDPNVQFLSLRDAARALVAAAESECTGILNAAGAGAVPLKKAFRAAGTSRIPLLKPLAQAFVRNASVAQLQYNWTVSGERARKELGFEPLDTTVDALRMFLATKPGAQAERLRDDYDLWGMDEQYIRSWGWWFAFLRNVYWRIDFEGMEHIPATGRAMFVSNHRGFMPLDAVMHLSLVLTQRRRIIRFLIIHSLLRLPFLCNFLTKLGGVIASQENAARLFAAEDLVGIFPEGIRGTFTPYRSTYRLRDFSKSEFMKIAIENQAPIIPAAVIGHSEIFPIVGRINSSLVTRELGWPYLPIAPMFPLAPVPIPSKWHVRILKPVSLTGLSPADAANPRIVKDLSDYVQNMIQVNIDHMLSRRKSIFWGRVLDGTEPAPPQSPLSMKHAAGEN
jgi:1-acyl-sn-glycerol-3-phosphate acyltransferase/nucleoside-diphosphate-sugar epimerase